MRQCTIRFISMYELTLCLEVLCVSEWSTSFNLVDRRGTCSKKLYAKRQVQLSLATETQILKYPIHIYMFLITYFTNQGNSHISQNWNQANATIMRKKTSLTKLCWVWVGFLASFRNFATWQSTSKVKPLIGTCFRKWHFPCDDQIRINDIVTGSEA